MYLYSRNVQMSGDPRKTRQLALRIAEVARERTQLQISLWTAVLGRPAGSLSYTTLVQSMSELESATSSLVTDPEYLDAVTEAQAYTLGPPSDQVLEILHTSGGEYRRAEVGAIVNLTTANIANARFGAAIGWAIEMSDLVQEISGARGIFGRGLGGQFGAVAWIGSVPDMAAFDAVNEALGKDPRYLEKLDQMGDLFIQGSGMTTVARRIA